MRQPHVYNRTRNTNVFTSTRPTGLRPRPPWNGQAKSPFYRSVAHFFFPIEPTTRRSFIVFAPTMARHYDKQGKDVSSICFLSSLVSSFFPFYDKFFFFSFWLVLSIDYKSVKELSVTVLHDKGDRGYRLVNISDFMAGIKSFRSIGSNKCVDLMQYMSYLVFSSLYDWCSRKIVTLIDDWIIIKKHEKR